MSVSLCRPLFCSLSGIYTGSDLVKYADTCTDYTSMDDMGKRRRDHDE